MLKGLQRLWRITLNCKPVFSRVILGFLDPVGEVGAIERALAATHHFAVINDDQRGQDMRVVVGSDIRIFIDIDLIDIERAAAISAQLFDVGLLLLAIGAPFRLELDQHGMVGVLERIREAVGAQLRDAAIGLGKARRHQAEAEYGGNQQTLEGQGILFHKNSPHSGRTVPCEGRGPAAIARSPL